MVRWDTHDLKAVRPGLNGFLEPTLRDLVDLAGTGLSREERKLRHRHVSSSTSRLSLLPGLGTSLPIVIPRMADAASRPDKPGAVMSTSRRAPTRSRT